MEKISAVIITKNEAANIGRCLDSLEGVADEVVVVDSGSSDDTEALCARHGVRFVSHGWEGYADQKNYANSLASHPWLLSIDADEALSEALRESVMRLKNNGMDAATVYSFCRLNSYCGQWIRHGGWYPDVKPRLWHAGNARWEGTVHEELRLADNVTGRLTLDGDLLHYSYSSSTELAERQQHYAGLAAREAYDRGRRVSALGVWLRPVWTFLRNYLLRGGFLDGRAGYTVCRMSARYTFSKYSDLRDLQNDMLCQKEK